LNVVILIFMPLFVLALYHSCQQIPITMISVFGYEISAEIILTILVVNTLLLIAAVIGFTNLKLQIRDLKALLHQIREKQKELKK
jgi:hypothetical protein